MVRRFFSRNRHPGVVAMLALGIGILSACLLGIAIRPDNMLSTFWPTNALLLGWLLRQRRLAGATGWIIAAIAYMAADLLTGSGLIICATIVLSLKIAVIAQLVVLAIQIAQAVAAAVEEGRQALVLLPEIALTEPMLTRFAARDGVEPVPWHRGLR